MIVGAGKPEEGIDGASGPFVAMPSRRFTVHCPRCRCKNHLKSTYCNQCGLKLDDQPVRDELGRNKLYADIAHPINSACREMIQLCVIQAFEEELEKSKLPGYVSSYDDFGEESAEGTGGFGGGNTASYPGGRPHFPLPKTEPSRETTFGAGIFGDD